MSVTFGQICNFRNPNLVTFCLCMYLILNEEHFTFHLQKNILVRLLTVNIKNCLIPKIRKYDPILVTLLKMRPHYRKSGCENATPSSDTSPLASYKEVPSPPGYGVTVTLTVHQARQTVIALA